MGICICVSNVENVLKICESKFCSSVDHWRMLVWSVPIAVLTRRHPPPHRFQSQPTPVPSGFPTDTHRVPESPTEPSHPSTVFQGTSILCGQICWSRMFASLKSSFSWVRVCVYTFLWLLTNQLISQAESRNHVISNFPKRNHGIKAKETTIKK